MTLIEHHQSERQRQHAAHLARLARLRAAAVKQAVREGDLECERPAPVPVPVPVPAPARIVRDVIKVATVDETAAPITVKKIQRMVCARFGIDIRDLLSSRHQQARYRQIAMHLARRLTLFSYTQIGRQFYRDHTTVMHGINKIEALRTADPDMSAELEILEAAIRAGECPARIPVRIDRTLTTTPKE